MIRGHETDAQPTGKLCYFVLVLGIRLIDTRWPRSVASRPLKYPDIDVNQCGASTSGAQIPFNLLRNPKRQRNDGGRPWKPRSTPSLQQDSVNELVKRIRKLRWMRMEEEAKRLQGELRHRSTGEGDSVIATPRETD